MSHGFAAGYPAPPLNPAMGYPAPGQQNGTKSRGLFGHKSNSYSQGGPGGGSGGQSKVHSQASQLGQKVLDSAAHGFGFTLGEPHLALGDTDAVNYQVVCCPRMWVKMKLLLPVVPKV